jgi:hypothetical protein
MGEVEFNRTKGKFSILEKGDQRDRKCFKYYLASSTAYHGVFYTAEEVKKPHRVFFLPSEHVD